MQKTIRVNQERGYKWQNSSYFSRLLIQFGYVIDIYTINTVV